MSEFWIYLQIGLKHVLDFNGYSHILFLIALTVPYTFKDWKKVLLLVSIFAIGNTLALIFSVFGIVTIQAKVVEFLIPITILITALYSLFTAGKSAKSDSMTAVGFITFFFGIVHGLGFSNYFKSILASQSEKVAPLLEFALGTACAHITVVLAVLILGYIVLTFFRFSKRDWTLVMSAFVIGVVLPMVI